MTEKPKTVDFGAPDAFSIHLFRVMIPAARIEPVIIIEDYGYRGQEAGIPREEQRVVLKRHVWSGISDIARREFNDRLKAAKILTGRWHTGTNLVDRLAKSSACSHGQRKQPSRTRSPSSAASGRPCGQKNTGGSSP